MRQHKLALGTAQFGSDYGIANKNGKTPPFEVEAILEACKRNGITVLDTASSYGKAEQVLGAIGVSEFDVISKFMPNQDATALQLQLSNTLRQLGVTCLYGYLAHRPIELLKQPWEWTLLQEEKEKGHIKKIGFSLNRPTELHQLLDRGFLPDLVQVPYNYLDRRFEADFESLKKAGVEIHTRSVFLQGLFFMAPENIPSHFDAVKPFLKEVSKIDNLSGNLLNFVLQKQPIDKVVIGVESSVQLTNNLMSIEGATSIGVEPPLLTEDILLPMNWKKQYD